MRQPWEVQYSKPVTVLITALLATTQVTAQETLKRSAPSSTQTESAKPPIQDNSFLIEEAYNQEPGVVQHISVFAWEPKTHAWIYAFTQEWPLFTRRHQLSYTLPILSTGSDQGSGLGDIAINYRYQLAEGKRYGLFVAPRISLIVPSGNEREARGAGGTGVQVNLPITLEHSAKFVTHWNAGVTFTPSAKNALGHKAATRNYYGGGSIIWLFRPALNFMLEVARTREETVAGPDERTAEHSFFLAPGVRAAIDFPSGLQIVPGFAVPIGIGPSRGDRELFFYLSFEHPFSSAAKERPSP
jgi:hypothetical protein